MAQEKNDMPENDFPAGLAKPALRALFGAGYTRLDQLTTITEADLLKLHGMGPKAIGLIRGALDARGQSFAEPNKETMVSQDQVFDSPTGWVRSHIREYVESEGKHGHLWRGLPTLLLTTRGRKSGMLRRTALIYGRDGKNYLVVASNGGAPNHPLWYLNLVANPEVEIQVGADKLAARARTATPIEKRRLWPLMSKIFPQYDKYQAKATRDIPLVIVEPI
jgi:deazaflavin-dependent oxidoreductase (nitroreductase family)